MRAARGLQDNVLPTSSTRRLKVLFPKMGAFGLCWPSDKAGINLAPEQL